MKESPIRTYIEAQTQFFRAQGLALRAGLAGTLWHAGVRHGLGAFIKPLNSPSRYPEYRVFFRLLEDEINDLASRLKKDVTVLDASSPKLFSLLLAQRKNIRLTSIDVWDVPIREARSLAGGLSSSVRSRLRFGTADIRNPLAGELLNSSSDGRFDLTFAMSVIEHVEPNPNGDLLALQNMVAQTTRGGCLVVSVPVDVAERDEYTERPSYLGTQETPQGEKAFFQRVYSRERLERLRAAIADRATLEEAVFIRWPAEGAFRRFWKIRSTTVRGLLGPLFPMLAPGFVTKTTVREIHPIDGPGDVVLKFRCIC